MSGLHITNIASNYKSEEQINTYVQPLDGMIHSERVILTLDYISKCLEHQSVVFLMNAVDGVQKF